MFHWGTFGGVAIILPRCRVVERVVSGDLPERTRALGVCAAVFGIVDVVALTLGRGRDFLEGCRDVLGDGAFWIFFW